MASIYFTLLKEWCDSLVALQINDIKTPGVYGGIMCPACSRIHGRSADSIYPLMYMAHATGEQRYIDAAVRLQAWSEHVSSPDGSWVNEPDNLWKEITVFGALSLGEALRHHGMLLEKEVYDRWMKRLEKAAAYVYENFTMDTGNINYPISASASLYAAGMVLGKDIYLAKAREFAHNSLKYFTENKLLFGEGHPQDGFTPRGCRPVDLGYNVEESLPAMALYGLLSGDEAVLEAVTGSLKEHLQFMLPDGAWDNSWGSRSFKWTYWGSRTSDGCQTAYALLAGCDRTFAEAALRNTMLLKACTHDGILYGGPHYHLHGELPCIHHTLCHTKALAAVLDYAAGLPEFPQETLPRESAQGVREYPEISTWLAAVGPWKGTVTAYDWEYMKEGHASGGSITMLWHKELGPLLAGSLTQYSMKEPSNMQRVKDAVDMALTPRLELCLDGRYYRSTCDYNAAVEYQWTVDEVQFKVKGKLVDGDQKSPASDEVQYELKYVFKPDSIEITADSDFTGSRGELRYYIPVISDRTEDVKRLDVKNFQITKKGIHNQNDCAKDNPNYSLNDNRTDCYRKLYISSDLPIEVFECEKGRIFNHVPGFEAIPLYVRAAGKCRITITAG